MAEDITLLREKDAGVREYAQLQDKVIVIGDAATVIGFKLAGVSEAYAAEGKDAEKKLVELIDRENAGIIIVNDRVLGQLDWRLKRKLEAIAKPVVVGVPDKFGPAAEAESLAGMIKRALGVELAR